MGELTQALEVEADISWAVNIFEIINKIRQSDEAKIRTVNLLVEKEGRIQIQSQELVTR